MIEASALSSAKEHTYTSCANTHRHPWWNFICRSIRSSLRRIPECSCPSVHFAIDCMKEGMERVSPVQLAFLRPLMAWLCWCKGPRPRTTTPQKFRCQLQCQGLLVSQWHSLPKGTGTFPAAYLGASSLCVRCVAMLPLPSKLQDDTSSHEIDWLHQG